MNYWEYIRVEELLSLQSGIDRDENKVSNDETLFIVVHQIYELWFKLILNELTLARDILQKRPVPDMELASAARSLKRVVVIFEQAVQHFKVMETLTTRDYLEFRDRLFHASGFQSAQLREIEILMGLDDDVRIPYGKVTSYKDVLKGGTNGESSPALRRVEARLAAGPSLKSVLYEWLSRTPIEGSDNTESSNRFIEAFIKAYRSENRRRIRLASKDPPSPVDLERLKDRFEKDAAAAEAFLRADDAPDEERRAFLRRVRAGILFLESYRELPRLTWPREVVDTIIETEQSMIIWRQRHARMVERVIGRRTGTGGSPGVDYLEQTAERYRIFSDLWTIRSLLLRKAKVPTIENTDEYRFRIED